MSMAKPNETEHIKSNQLFILNLYQKITKGKENKFSFPCADLNKIAIDKIIAFENKANTENNDKVRITRHIYDVYKILNHYEKNAPSNILKILQSYKKISQFKKEKITENI